MFNNHIKITKNDVQVCTNGDCVDVRMAPADQKGKHARVITVTLKRDTAVHLRDALEVYFKLDSTM